MARNKQEMKFCTALKHAFKAKGHFFFKLPDSPSAQRFMIAKPYDATACVNGASIAIEAKVLKKYEAFGRRHLRETQIKGLDDHARAKGLSYVILEVMAGRGDYRMLFWRWDHFVKAAKNGTIKKSELEAHPYIQRNADESYNIGTLLNEIDYSTF